MIIDHTNIQRLKTQQIWISDKHPNKHPTNINLDKHEQSTKCTHTIKGVQYWKYLMHGHQRGGREVKISQSAT